MSATASPLEFQQIRFKEDYDAAKIAAKKLSHEATYRRVTAYVLKGIAVFGGIAVAAGLRGHWSQGIGILISVAVTADGLFANHKRLLMVTKAANAYSLLLETISHRYDQALAPILADKARELGKMISSASDMLFAEKKKIDVALQGDDLKLLNSLSVEGSTTTREPTKG